MKKFVFRPLLGLVLSICLGLLHNCTPPSTGGLLQDTDLEIHQLASGVYQHISYLETESFGKVACNGGIYISGNEAVVFDTPVSDSVSAKLIDYIQTRMGKELVAVFAGHFHEDCLGGLEAFHEAGIPSYSTRTTQEFAQKNDFPIPQNGFDGEMELTVGETRVIGYFPGEGHTRDNMVLYLTDKKALFGGCLIKSLAASQGFTGDANLETWAQTVGKVATRFPGIRVVLPGHGAPGGRELLDYTIELFSPSADPVN